MKRLITAAVMIPVVLYAVFWGPWWVLLGFLVLIGVAAYVEFAGIAGLPPFARILGVAGGIGLLLLPAAQVFLGSLLFAMLLIAVALRDDTLKAAFPSAFAAFLGVFYIFGALKACYLLHAVSAAWLFFALAINWVGDSGAYYIGRRFGKHKLAPRISPAKSIEGSVASIAFSVLFGVLVLPRIAPGVSLVAAGALALCGNIAGQLGDLVESAMKRSAGVKDSGTLLPGHGGMLDRIDSVLFSVPVVYELVVLLRY